MATWRQKNWSQRGDSVGTIVECPIKSVTGRDCPACGITRSMGALTQGDIVRAADHNLLVTSVVMISAVLFIAFSASTFVRSSVIRWLANPPTIAVWSLVVTIAVFTVARNTSLPLGQWLLSGEYTP